MPEGRRSISLGLAVIVVAYASGILLNLGIVGDFKEIYPASEPYLNLQAAALASGEFALSDQVKSLQFDLAWAGGGVQQVWGLGVPGWILGLAALSGMRDPLFYPSRIAFGVALTIVSWLVLLLLVRGARVRLKGIAVVDWRYLGVVVPTLAIVWFFPSFTATLKSSFRVYEEVSAYGYLSAILLGVLLIWFSAKPSAMRLLILVLVAGLSPFVRPTLGLYGLSAILVGLWLAMRAGLRGWKVACAVVSYLGLTGLLLWSNSLRFGSPLEFGHSLNASHHAGLLYSNRFGSPFESAPFLAALGELLGALLFDNRFNYGDWFGPDVFQWQSATLRWRENYLPAIGWPLIGLAIVGSLIVLARSRRGDPERILIAWCFLALVGHVLFYLRLPVLSSRYLYDFAGAIATAAAAAWWHLSTRAVQSSGWRDVLTLFVGIGICFYLCQRAQTARSGEEDAISCTKYHYEQLLARMRAPLATALTSNESGTVELQSGRFVGRLDIPFECQGWSPGKGEVNVVTTHFVRDMEFLELDVMPLADGPSLSPSVDWIRVRTGTEFLVRQNVEKLGNRLKVRFRSPVNSDYRKGIQAVFIGWVPKEKLSDEYAPWIVHSIKWRNVTLPSPMLDNVQPAVP